jgi:signal transduction histidine kinase/phage shock protein PspC (stress-responsive transcriptional regulator)
MYVLERSAIIRRVKSHDAPGVAPSTRAEFVRPEQERMVAGVAAGLGRAFGIDPNVVRCGFVVLSVASGFGVVWYLIAWAVMPEAARDEATPVARSRCDADVISTVAFGGVVLGGLLLARAVGLWPGDVVVWPLAAAMAGLALLAMRTGATAPTAELPDWPILRRLPADAADALAVLVGTRRGALARIIAGAACVAAGVVAFVITVDSWRALRGAFIATIAVLVGIALVVAPGLSRLAHALVAEKRERIRSDERAEVAAHLHDSVLQTLALVQRRANDPREVVRLARLQERELRSWLLAGGTRPEPDGSASLGTALEDAAAEIETRFGVPVEVVRVRDCVSDGMDALLLAAREAIVNAAQHAGASSVSVYLEVEGERATIFVRDRGRGFDPVAVPEDRGGIANSIVGRMTRAGGRASVRSTVGEGTEVELEMPRARA